MDATTYYYIIGFVIAMGLIVAYNYYSYQKTQRDMRNGTGDFDMPDHVAPGYFERLISLDCYNLKFLQYAFGTGWWLGAILFLLISLSEFHILSDIHQVIDAISSGYVLGGIYVSMLLCIIYYIYSRTKLKWDDKLTIDGQQVQVSAFYIRKPPLFRNVVYLQTPAGLKILVPAAKEATYKFKNMDVLARERQQNEEQVEKLRAKLTKQGVPEKAVGFFVPYLILGFAAFWILFLVTLYALNRH